LIELAAVLVMIAVLAAVSFPKLSTLNTTRNRYAARQLFKDLTFARSRAVATATRVFVVFAPASETYTVLAEDPTNPGRANALIISDPSTNAPFVRTFGGTEYAGVDMVSADFDGGNEVGFDWNGKPLNSGQTALAATGTVTMSGGNLVQVRADGGLITCTTP
jgi:Tfp pilus assembly protein FimT